jgi:cytochrome c
MNTMEITKIIGAVCGSLLIFLLIQTAAHSIYNTHSEEVAFSVEVEEPSAEGGEAGGDGEEAAPEEAVDVAAMVAEADPGAGERVFNKCGACHKVEPGANAVGPSLHGVVGRDIASMDGFNYSGSLPEGTWTEEELFKFLEAPRDYAPGTSMSFAGLAKPEDRADVIAYLESVAN